MLSVSEVLLLIKSVKCVLCIYKWIYMALLAAVLHPSVKCYDPV